MPIFSFREKNIFFNNPKFNYYNNKENISVSQCINKDPLTDGIQNIDGRIAILQ